MKTNLQKSKSFYDWCYSNLSKEKADEIISRWDYKLNIDKKGNIITPKDISYSSHGFNKKGYWFKCLRGIHPSELKNINSFTNKHVGFIECSICHSIGQYLIDTYGQNALEKYWDYDKNNKLGLDLFKLSKNSGKKIWIKCQKHDYHGSYFITCNGFIDKHRCPFCSNSKVHYLDSLGYLYPESLAYWSNKNKKSPYEYKPKSNKEVYWKCPEGRHKEVKRKISVSKYLNFRCPECSHERDGSIIQEKTKLYLESLKYNVLHEYNCTLKCINIKTKMPLPYDNEIILQNGKHLICEVNGIQHYEICGLTKLLAKRKKQHQNMNCIDKKCMIDINDS